MNKTLWRLFKFTYMKINYHKSVSIFPKASIGMIPILAQRVEFQVKSFPIKYLRLLLVSGSTGTMTCGEMISSLRKAIGRWKSKKLSYWGECNY